MNTVKTYKEYLNESIEPTKQVEFILESFNSSDQLNLNLLFKDTLDENFEEIFNLYLTEAESIQEEPRPKAGSLAKSTMIELVKRAGMGWVIGTIITKAIQPVAAKVGGHISTGAKKFGASARKFGVGAGKEVTKEYGVLKKAISNLSVTAKKYPLRSVGVVVAIILAAAATKKIYNIIKERNALQAKLELYKTSEETKERAKIEALENKIKELAQREQEEKVKYAQDVKDETKIQKEIIRENPEHIVQLVNKAESSLNL